MTRPSPDNLPGLDPVVERLRADALRHPDDMERIMATFALVLPPRARIDVQLLAAENFQQLDRLPPAALAAAAAVRLAASTPDPDVEQTARVAGVRAAVTLWAGHHTAQTRCQQYLTHQCRTSPVNSATTPKHRETERTAVTTPAGHAFTPSHAPHPLRPVLDLMALHEICQRTHFSRQSVYLLQKDATFPVPFARLTRGRIYRGDDLRDWFTQRYCSAPNVDLRRHRLPPWPRSSTQHRLPVVSGLPMPHRPIMGVPELSARLGVCRQRGLQLATAHYFPAPVAVLAVGRIFLTADVEEWISRRRPWLYEGPDEM